MCIFLISARPLKHCFTGKIIDLHCWYSPYYWRSGEGGWHGRRAGSGVHLPDPPARKYTDKLSPCHQKASLTSRRRRHIYNVSISISDIKLNFSLPKSVGGNCMGIFNFGLPFQVQARHRQKKGRTGNTHKTTHTIKHKHVQYHTHKTACPFLCQTRIIVIDCSTTAEEMWGEIVEQKKRIKMWFLLHRWGE